VEYACNNTRLVLLSNREEGIVDDFVLLDELNGILRVGVHDLNEAAKRLGVPLSFVKIAFADGILKGYWKVADGKLFIPTNPEWVRPRAKAA
jgi:hypothetical protein